MPTSAQTQHASVAACVSVVPPPVVYIIGVREPHVVVVVFQELGMHFQDLYVPHLLQEVAHF